MRPSAVLKAVLTASKVMQVSPVGPGIIRAHPLADEDGLDLGGWPNLWEHTPATISSTAKGNRNAMVDENSTTKEKSFKVFFEDFWLQLSSNSSHDFCNEKKFDVIEMSSTYSSKCKLSYKN